MAEYIEREQAINFARSSAAAAYNRDDFYAYRGLNAFIATLVQIPAADVAPVKHGHWIYDKDAECVYCSSCLQFNANEYTNKFSIRSKFCSRCGARMDEEEQGFDA